VFEAELTAMLDAGAGLIVGTVDDRGEPRATRAWGAAADPASPGALRVAVTGADVRTLRSVQVKGRILATAAPTEAELRMVDEQTERFLVGIHETDGNPIELLRRMLPRRIVMIEVDVSGVYDQTPGPDAGVALEAERS
jgi:hypothetical protein